MQTTGRDEPAVREEYRQEFNISRFGTVEDLGSLDRRSWSSPHGRWLHGAPIDIDGGEGRRSVLSDACMRGRMNILLTPARIGPAEIPNRIVMPPMTTRGSDEEGNVTDQTVAYYMARVRGGTGLITVEMASPEKAGRHRRRELGIYDDDFIPGLTRLVSEIHRGGAKASIQLGHGGGHTRIDICGEQPVAPSAIPHPVYEVTFETIIPEAMTQERIAQTTANYVAAAERAQQAGFDCVEIHAAHGYLISHSTRRSRTAAPTNTAARWRTAPASASTCCAP